MSGIEGPRRSAIGAALLALGDRWTLLILQRAFVLRTRRFGDWRDQLGLSEATLAARLKEMVSAELLVRVPYDDNGRMRDEYRLTPRALELWSLLLAIWGWEQTSLPIADAAPVLIHDGCGSRMSPVLGCDGCGAAGVSARDTTAERGAQAEFATISVPRLHRRAKEPSGELDPLSYYPETMAILGDRWSTAVLAAAFLGIRRFSDFRDELGVAPSILSDRLRRFVVAGVLHEPDADGEYRLTVRGMGFFPVYALLVTWAQRWCTQGTDDELIITHVVCGRRFQPMLLCSACGEQLTRTGVHFALDGAA